jgi:CRP/FNR family transcriptional regulator
MERAAPGAGVERLGHPDCATCPVRSMALFADLSEKKLEQLSGSIDDLSVPEGTVLYEHARNNTHVFVLRSGALKLVQILHNGSERIVRLPRPGDAIGLEILLDRPYQHRAVMMQAGRVCRLPKRLLQDLGAEQPGVYRKLLDKWELAVEEADYFITSLSSGSAEARVARLLLYSVQSHAHGDFSPIGREDMAAALSLTVGTASRVMAEFKRKGWVEEHAGHTKCDLKALRACAEDE